MGTGSGFSAGRTNRVSGIDNQRPGEKRRYGINIRCWVEAPEQWHCKWAVALGCRVFVTSGSGKIKNFESKAKQLGALAGVSYKAQDWAEELLHLSGGFNVIIDSALGEGFAKFADLAKPGGRIVYFGATAGDMPAIPGHGYFIETVAGY